MAALLLASVVAAIRVPARIPTASRVRHARDVGRRAHLLQPRRENDDFYYLRNRTNARRGRQMPRSRRMQRAARTRCANAATPVAEFVAQRRVCGRRKRRDGRPTAPGNGVRARPRPGECGSGARTVWRRLCSTRPRRPRRSESGAFGGAYRGFVRGVSHVAVAPDGEAVAYTVDPTGDEKRRASSSRRAGGGARRRDCGLGRDARLRAADGRTRAGQHEVWPTSCGGAEELVYREDDERFRLEFGGGDAGAIGLARSRDAAEVLRVADGAVEVEAARTPGVGFLGADARSGVLGASRRAGTRCAREGRNGRRGARSRPSSRPSWRWRGRGGGGRRRGRRAARPGSSTGTRLRARRATGALRRGHTAARPAGLQRPVSAPHRFARVLAYDVAARTWLETPPPPSAFEDSLVVERLRRSRASPCRWASSIPTSRTRSCCTRCTHRPP